MLFCFVYNCITWFNMPSVWLQSLIIRTIKCNVQVIIILKCWDFSWNKIILILWAVKDIKDWKQGWHVTDRKKNKLKMRAMLASGLKRSKKDRSRYFVRSFCPTVSVLKRKKKKEGKLTFWRDFEQNKDQRKRKDWIKKKLKSLKGYSTIRLGENCLLIDWLSLSTDLIFIESMVRWSSFKLNKHFTWSL